MYNYVEYYYVKNLQGDIIGLVNDQSTSVVEYSYYLWGDIQSTFGSLSGTLGAANPFRYRGYYYDAETELYYVGSRYYSPELCRFICPDKTAVLHAETMKLTSKNLYAYCDNNPVSKKDPNGKLPVAAMAIGAGINVLSSWIIAEASGDDFDKYDIFAAAISGAVGSVGKIGLILSTVTDCVYECFVNRSAEGVLSNFVVNLFFNALSVPGMMTWSNIEMDKALGYLIDFGIGTGTEVVDVVYGPKDSSNSKSGYAPTVMEKRPEWNSKMSISRESFYRHTIHEKNMGHMVW